MATYLNGKDLGRAQAVAGSLLGGACRVRIGLAIPLEGKELGTISSFGAGGNKAGLPAVG